MKLSEFVGVVTGFQPWDCVSVLEETGKVCRFRLDQVGADGSCAVGSYVLDD